MGRDTGTIRIGLSGWSYPEWRGDFYPDHLPRDEELAYAASRFGTLEINRTFYSLAGPEAFITWYARAPARFKYGVKGSRFITHNKKLLDPEQPLANFMASGVLHLKEKLGPILWQLGPHLRFDPARVDHFFSCLPRDLDGVAALAARNALTKGAWSTPPDHNHRVRHVIEIRHESFFVPEMAELARHHHVAIAFSHSTAWPYTEELTASLVYLRLHGPGALYSSAYSDKELEEWAARIRAWADGSQPKDARRITDLDLPGPAGRDVFVYFDNDSGGHAPRQAAALARIIDRER